MTKRIELQDGTVVDAIDAYLDGLMSASQVAEFEQRLAEEQGVRDEIEQQHRIDESLAQQFAAPAAEFARELEDVCDDGGRSRNYRLSVRGLAVAAAIGMAAVGVWRITQFDRADDGPSAGGGIPAWSSAITLADAYRAAEKEGFKPSWVCKDDAEFSETFAKSVNQPLLLAHSPGVAALGLGYSHIITEGTLLLLVRVDGRGVIVFVDKLNYDPGLTLPEDADLQLFRREVGRAVLYELTPLDESRVLGAFYDPTKQ